ncbi:MAG: hypothetical protein GY841_23520 [FCB group bacterium]|nr:hypothetical protein [FCB group bacterium]
MSAKETIKFDKLKRLCFCNSDELLDKVFIIGGKAHEWVGIGMVELKQEPDPEKHITVIE